MVTLIQRFGSAANLNIHLHCLVLDGVYLNLDGGQKVLSLQSLPSRVRASAPELHVNAHGLNLHAAVR